MGRRKQDALRLNANLGIPLDNNWHSVSIPLSSFTGVDLTTIRIPMGVSSDTDTSFTYYVDNARWKQN